MEVANPRIKRALDLAREMAVLLIDADVTEKDAAWIVRSHMVAEAIRRARGNRMKAARILGIPPPMLEFWVRELHLEAVQSDVDQLCSLQLKLFPERGKRPISSETHEISSAFSQKLAQRAG